MTNKMEYQTFEIEIEGHKITVSDDPAVTIKDFDREKLYECVLIEGEYYGFAYSPKSLINIEEFRPSLLKMLLREIEYIKKRNPI